MDAACLAVLQPDVAATRHGQHHRRVGRERAPDVLRQSRFQIDVREAARRVRRSIDQIFKRHVHAGELQPAKQLDVDLARTAPDVVRRKQRLDD